MASLQSQSNIGLVIKNIHTIVGAYKHLACDYAIDIHSYHQRVPLLNKSSRHIIICKIDRLSFGFFYEFSALAMVPTYSCRAHLFHSPKVSPPSGPLKKTLMISLCHQFLSFFSIDGCSSMSFWQSKHLGREAQSFGIHGVAFSTDSWVVFPISRLPSISILRVLHSLVVWPLL